MIVFNKKKCFNDMWILQGQSSKSIRNTRAITFGNEHIEGSRLLKRVIDHSENDQTGRHLIDLNFNRKIIAVFFLNIYKNKLDC